MYQYAILEDYRRNFKEAIQKCRRQMKMKPTDNEIAVKLHFFYQALLLHVSSDEVKNWLLENNTGESRYFLGEFYRQKKQFVAADSVFRTLMGEELQMSRIPVYLSLVKLHMALANRLQAEAIYWQAFDELEDSLDAGFMFENIKHIFDDAEVTEFRELREITEYKAFLRRFWAKRDPMPASADNLRLTEHFRRLLFTEANFRYDRFRTWHFNPDRQEFLSFPESYYLNHEYNDRGLVYLRHGPPDDKATGVRGSTANISWLFNPEPGYEKIILHFESIGEAGDWRLTPMVENMAAVENMLLWDEAYIRFWRGNDVFVRNEIANARKENSAAATSTDRHSWSEKVEPLPVYFTLANFRLDDRRNICDLYIGFPIQTLLEPSGQDTVVIVDLGAAVQDTSWNVLQRRNQFVKIHPGHQAIVRGQFIASYEFRLAPETYNFSTYVDPVDLPALGGLKVRASIPSFHKDSLSTSDIQLAYFIAPEEKSKVLSKTNMQFIPNPARRFISTDPLYVYFEIYNLTPDEQGQTSFKIKYSAEDTENKKKGGFLGLFGAEQMTGISLESARTGTSESTAEFRILDVSQLEVGKKKLVIRVEDNNSGQWHETDTEFWLVEEKR
jgi:GWxTD domain-containing protein